MSQHQTTAVAAVYWHQWYSIYCRNDNVHLCFPLTLLAAALARGENTSFDYKQVEFRVSAKSTLTYKLYWCETHMLLF